MSLLRSFYHLMDSSATNIPLLTELVSFVGTPTTYIPLLTDLLLVCWIADYQHSAPIGALLLFFSRPLL